MTYFYLVLAILAETIGTTALQASQQFTRPLPSALVVIGYALSFYLLSLVLRTIPVGVAYAIWSGLGICLTAFLGWLFFKQGVDLAALLGMALIVAGIVVINLYSKTATH